MKEQPDLPWKMLDELGGLLAHCFVRVFGGPQQMRKYVLELT
jgi:hypothetical protein